MLKIKTECANCCDVVEVEILCLIKTMFECLDNDSIFCGVLCKECAAKTED